MVERPHILFVTGRLAEPALRRVLAELTQRMDLAADVAVLPISVAALLTTDWVANHLTVPKGTARIVLPGFCRGDLDLLACRTAAKVELGPKDLRDLPGFFGRPAGPPPGYGRHSLQIIAEINHCSDLPANEIQAVARRLADDGADLIDLGCDPGATWSGIGDVALLRDEGLRVSVDSFNPVEVEAALAAGAELVLSVNSTNRERAKAWHEAHGAEVVAIPDTPDDLAGLDQTVQYLAAAHVPFRIDPVLEPIGFGFAASLGRFLEVRRRYPRAGMLMGVGNLTELTDADFAAINVLLAGFCQEQNIGSVLTTQVINWCRSCVRELDLARRLVFHAVQEKVVSKRLEPRLVLLRDPKLREMGEAAMRELAERVTDRNYRLFAERGELHILNGQMYVRGTDPFVLAQELFQRDSKIDPAHAFYLGYELAKAVTALTLGKNYEQDQALNWGMLIAPEASAHGQG